jgi:hypothetical protein
LSETERKTEEEEERTERRSAGDARQDLWSEYKKNTFSFLLHHLPPLFLL